MKTIRKLFLVVAGLLSTLSTQAQIKVSGSTNDVGEIPIQYALSRTGAITYQIPIDIHSDPEQFQPQLSFGYSSQQGESAMGYGWNIGGLSSIGHVSGSIYHDGATTPLSTSEDKLALDGMRLIKKGTDTWQTEQGFIKVKKLADGTLEVRYPNGNTATYETSSNTPFSYLLTDCRNLKGHTIKYVYTTTDNLPYIRKIMYAENEGTYNDSIVFDYQKRTDGITRYVDGKPLKQSLLLSSVTSYYHEKLWRRYRLTYEKEEVNQLVRLDCETESCSLPPLTFEYGDKRSIEYFNKNEIFMQQYFHNNVQGEAGYRSLVLSRGHFSSQSNSDGLISYPQQSTYRVVKYGSGHSKYDSFYDESQNLLVYKELSDRFVTPIFFTAGKGFQQLTAVDIDGDGVDALVKVNYYLNETGSYPVIPRYNEKLVVEIYPYLASPTSHRDFTYESSNYVNDGGLRSPRQREFLFGDFNGDGKIEMLAISSCRNHVDRNSKTASHALMIDLDSRKALFDGNCFDYTFFQQMELDVSPDRLIAMDYNGDGKTDICLINHDGTSVYEFTGSGFKQLAFVNSSNGVCSSHFNFEDQELMVSDINGDGNMDLILPPRYSHCRETYKHLGNGICCSACNDERNLSSTSASGYKTYIHPYSKQQCVIDPSVTEREVVTQDNGKTWRFVLSTGNSGYSNNSPGFNTYSKEMFRSFYETAGLNFMLIDVDSDGLPDMLRNVCGKIDLYLNKDGKISDTPNVRATQKLTNLQAQFATANVAQSYYWSGGLICVDNGTLHVYDYTRKENMERMVRNMTDSHGIKTNHYYTDIMNASTSRYETGYNELGLNYLSYPYQVLSPHCYVGVWAKKENGNDILSWEDYKYYNAVFHRQGLGFVGFQKIETNDFANARKATSTIDPTLRGAEVRRETPTDTIVRKYVMQVNPDKTFLLNLQKETKTNVLSRTENTVDYGYNTYGQPIRSFLSLGGIDREETVSEYLNVDNETTYLLGLPTVSTTYKTRNDSVITQSSVMSYDSHHMPVNKTSSVNGNTIQEERFTYNDALRLTKQEQRNYDSTDWLTKTYTYDAAGLLARETDAMGLHIDYAYDAATGLLLTTTDHKGLSIRNEYDEWGKPIAMHYPDGRVKRTVATWCNESEPGEYVIITTETGKPTVKTYYDRLNRELRASQIRFDGKEMKTDKKYAIKTGLLERASQPTTDDQPSRWNLYTYDKYNRLTSTRHASGKVDSCAYGILTDTIIENGIRHIRKYDEAGIMIQATDPAGSIDYYYRPDGQPVVVVAPGGVQTRFYYDRYGRRIAIKDPSAGIRRTEYDAAGNTCKETDADGREIRKEYDRYGRTISQTTPELNTVYTYDDTDNLLLSAVSNNGTAIRYTYDAYGRMKTRREECSDSKWLEKEYAYTDNGIPSSIAYSSAEGALTTENLTYTNGYLTEVRLSDETLIYRHDEENALGQLTKLTTGEMHRNYTFNEWGLPTKRTISRADGSVLFNHSYGFNVENNNLESRKDEARGLMETFGYDPLNRLSTYGGLQVIYDNSGNILSKGDAGTLAYTNPNRPYTVTGLQPTISKQLVTGLDITYTAAQRPSTISQGLKRAMLTYNANHDRVRMQLSDADSVTFTRYYLGDNYEQDIDSTGISEKLYLGGNYYSAPAVLMKQGGQTKVYYIHRDYLGSILQIADAQGSIVEENSYDAWGCRRNPSTQLVYASGAAPKLLLGRGYTGHEHLEMFGVINMNARLYDPILGRFLSPDPFVQAPDFTQAFNRYSYCMNSPLCYVDENGEFWWIVAAAVIGGAINVATHWDSIDNFSQGLGYFGIGAAAGAVGAVAGGAALAASGVAGGIAGGAIAGLVGGATSGFILGGGNTFMAGGNFADASMNAMTGMFTGAVTGAVMGGFAGGATSFFRGENVWNGQELTRVKTSLALKDYQLNSIEHPEARSFSANEGLSALPDDPLLNNMSNTPMNSYDKGQLGVKEAIGEFKAAGGEVYAQEVSIDVPNTLPNGTTTMVRNRFDFVGELDGKLHLFEVKNGHSAGFTPNQKINLPKLIMDHPQFIPRGGNALKVPQFERIIGRPYVGNYIVVIKHYF